MATTPPRPPKEDIIRQVVAVVVPVKFYAASHLLCIFPNAVSVIPHCRFSLFSSQTLTYILSNAEKIHSLSDILSIVDFCPPLFIRILHNHLYK